MQQKNKILECVRQGAAVPSGTADGCCFYSGMILLGILAGVCYNEVGWFQGIEAMALTARSKSEVRLDRDATLVVRLGLFAFHGSPPASS